MYIFFGIIFNKVLKTTSAEEKVISDKYLALSKFASVSICLWFWSNKIGS